MKVGLSTSLVLHAAAIGFGLFSLSAPREMIVADFESFPVDIVPVEEFSQSVRGDRQAEVAETPAPTPTSRPDPVEDATNVGDNTVDLQNAPTPAPREREVETASVPPPPPPEPAPQPERAPEPEPALPPPPQEQPAEAAPPTEPTPAEAPRPEAVQLPQSAPVPTQRPREQPRTQTAQATPQREPERPREQPRQEQTQQNSESVEDQVAALLNRDRASGGGAQRSQQEAALGGRETTGARLSQSEIDALRAQVQRCWNPPVGVADAEGMVVSIRIRLSPAGELESDPQVVAGGGASIAERAAADAARRAVLRCAPFNAPSDKYEAWADVQFNFDPRDMF
jgi:outer membrane biosynthesis protein TonB